jgi:hypothetical protein
VIPFLMIALEQAQSQDSNLHFSRSAQHASFTYPRVPPASSRRAVQKHLPLFVPLEALRSMNCLNMLPNL